MDVYVCSLMLVSQTGRRWKGKTVYLFLFSGSLLFSALGWLTQSLIVSVGVNMDLLTSTATHELSVKTSNRSIRYKGHKVSQKTTAPAINPFICSFRKRGLDWSSPAMSSGLNLFSSSLVLCGPLLFEIQK